MRSTYLCFFALCLFAFTNNGFAHQLSTSYIVLNNNIDKTQYIGHWQISIADLEHAVALDLNNDGQITWAEIKAKRSSLTQFVEQNISFTQDLKACLLNNEGSFKLDTHFNQPYLQIPIRFYCDNNTTTLLTYSAFFNRDASHKSIVNINGVSRIFDYHSQKQAFNFEQTSYLKTFNQYVYQGVLHIWIGIDHILFLIALLLTCVLIRRDKTWQGSTSKLKIIKHTAWIITAFTLAHSITLTATAMNLVSPNSRWVELGIAMSVLFAALNNVWPVVIRLGWLTFGFGLLHGMGFASVLGELGLSEDYQLLSIIAFNLGVELGQLSILCVSLPILIYLRNYNWYQKWLMPSGSILIALIALQWSIERY